MDSTTWVESSAAKSVPSAARSREVKEKAARAPAADWYTPAPLPMSVPTAKVAKEVMVSWLGVIVRMTFRERVKGACARVGKEGGRE